MKKIFLLLVLAASACTKEAPPASQEPGLVSKEKWSDAMTTAMPSIYCNPKGFFRSCFRQNENECLEAASRATKVCLLKFQGEMPANLKQPEDGEAYGKKVAACAGETMEISLTGEKKKIASAECNDPSKWTE